MRQHIQKQKQVKLNIDVNQLETISCPICKETVFLTNQAIFKVLPAVQSPNGKAQLIALPVVSCDSCDNKFFVQESSIIPV